MNSSIFDIVTLHFTEKGIYVELRISRPKNAPKYKRTRADFKRTKLAREANYDIGDKVFNSISDVFEYLNTHWPL